jgi:hypothetical protein
MVITGLNSLLVNNIIVEKTVFPLGRLFLFFRITYYSIHNGQPKVDHL